MHRVRRQLRFNKVCVIGNDRLVLGMTSSLCKLCFGCFTLFSWRATGQVRTLHCFPTSRSLAHRWTFVGISLRPLTQLGLVVNRSFFVILSMAIVYVLRQSKQNTHLRRPFQIRSINWLYKLSYALPWYWGLRRNFLKRRKFEHDISFFRLGESGR